MHVFSVFKRFGTILSKRQKSQMVGIFFLMVIGGILEMFSVSLVLPFMNVIMEPDKTMNNDIVRFVCGLFGIESSRGAMVFLAIILAFIFLAKNVFFLFEYNVQYKFVYRNMLSMQEKLLSTLIARPYEYFLKVNSGEIVRIINTDTPQAFVLLVSLLQLFTEFVAAGIIILTVFVIAPMITLVMTVVLLILVLIINAFLKPVLNRAGKSMQESSAGMNKWLLQSVRGIKDIKVTSKESFFTRKFNSYGVDYVDALRKSNLYVIFPRFIIEAVSMGVIFVVIAFMIWNGTELEVVIPALTAVAMAAMRLLPSMSRVSQCLGQISYNEPMLDKLIENLKSISGEEEGSSGGEYGTGDAVSPDGNTSESVEVKASKGLDSSDKVLLFERDICVSDLTYKYPDTDDAVLEDISFTIEKGQSVGIIGTSGSGKTTAVDLLLGVLSPEKGKVLLDGVDIKEKLDRFLSIVGYIPQSIFMMDDTIRANVAFGEDDVSDDEVWRALKDASLDEFVRDLPDGLDTEIGERGIRLSGGQKQRIGIARALYRKPQILFFDEATSALDNDTESSIMESIEHLKGTTTMVIIAHRLTTIENCDVVYRIEDGKIMRERP